MWRFTLSTRGTFHRGSLDGGSSLDLPCGSPFDGSLPLEVPRGLLNGGLLHRGPFRPGGAFHGQLPRHGGGIVDAVRGWPLANSLLLDRPEILMGCPIDYSRLTVLDLPGSRGDSRDRIPGISSGFLFLHALPQTLHPLLRCRVVEDPTGLVA